MEPRQLLLKRQPDGSAELVGRPPLLLLVPRHLLREEPLFWRQLTGLHWSLPFYRPAYRELDRNAVCFAPVGLHLLIRWWRNRRAPVYRLTDLAERWGWVRLEDGGFYRDARLAWPPAEFARRLLVERRRGDERAARSYAEGLALGREEGAAAFAKGLLEQVRERGAGAAAG